MTFWVGVHCTTSQNTHSAKLNRAISYLFLARTCCYCTIWVLFDWKIRELNLVNVHWFDDTQTNCDSLMHFFFTLFLIQLLKTFPLTPNPFHARTYYPFLDSERSILIILNMWVFSKYREKRTNQISGGFPIEIKTKTRFLIICRCHIFIR